MRDSDTSMLCENIKNLRLRNGYSKKKMAEICGISIGSLNKIEAGILPPRMTVDVLFRLEYHFGIRVSKLFGPME